MRRAQLIAALTATALAAVLSPAGAAAANLVPQENSAVSQYTESFPTGGGDKGSSTPGENGSTPARTIGAKNAKKLDEHGAEGRAAAEVAAVTAPPTPTSTGNSSSSSSGRAGSKGGKAGAKRGGGERQGGASRGGGAPAEPGQGASAVGSLVGAATGAEDGNLGLLLPLLLLATLVWGVAYAVRHRKRSATL